MPENNLRILLVEDNPRDVELLREALTGIEEPLELAHFERLDQAAEYLSQAAVDVILLDLTLPDSMGLATLELANRVAPHLPIIVLTGLEDEAIAIDAVRKGAQDYLVKGQTPPRMLVRRVHHAVQRKRLQQELQEARAAAEAANQAKSEFLANVSHELRTPMNAILGMTEIALGEPLTPAVRDYIQTAKDSADVLLELLNEILDFSRMEAGKFQLESVPFSLRRTVEQTLKAVGIRAYEKGLELVCDLADDVPDALVGDPLRLRQVVMNLVGNAIKFTRQGEVVVGVRVEGGERRAEGGERRAEGGERRAEGGERRAEGGNDQTFTIETEPSDIQSLIPNPGSTELAEVQSPIPNPQPEALLRFSVSDTGIGIACEDQQKIFAPFTQADASATRSYGGTGLGLAISSNLVKLMGGRIWLESQPGRGSTFYFTARLAVQSGAAGGLEPVPTALEQLRGLSLLVVTDNFPTRRVLEQLLVRWGMQPETVGDVPAALAKIHAAASAGRPFPVAIVDAAIPQIDGFTLAGWIKNDPGLVGGTILMVSAGDRLTHTRRCQELGAFCLEKPIVQSGLFNAIVQALGLTSPAAQGLPNSPQGEPAPAASPLRILLVEDHPANRKLALCILQNRGHCVESAVNGREAVQRARHEEFDLVLMDVQMPVMDGFQATAAIRALPDARKARLPIVAMTAHAMKGDQQRCLAAGMDGYVSKPINAQELIETIERLARNRP